MSRSWSYKDLLDFTVESSKINDWELEGFKCGEIKIRMIIGKIENFSF